MKLMQQETTFAPIALVFETEDEAEDFWQLIREYENGFSRSKNLVEIARKISNWFSTQAKL